MLQHVTPTLVSIQAITKVFFIYDSDDFIFTTVDTSINRELANDKPAF